MRIPFALLPLAAFLLVGCAHKQGTISKPTPGTTDATTANAAAPTSTTSQSTALPATLVVTPGSGLAGKVARYNDAGRFVVLEFPVGHLPAMEQRLFVYRNGSKVGEIKVTGPQKDVHIVADLTNGEAQAGDEVRDK